MPDLTFDPKLHEYRIDDQVVPSVTQILSEAGLVDGQWYTEESQLRGRTVHVMTALDDRGELDESEVTGEYQGYLSAWRGFKADTGCEIVSIEERVCNTVYRYAGTTDRRLLWNGPLYIADIKAGVPEWWHKIQTAGYWTCDAIDAAARCTIYLKRDGTWKARVAGSHSYDTDVFRAALTIANAKRNEGKTNGRDRNN
jgi:hypothetical protein